MAEREEPQDGVEGTGPEDEVPAAPLDEEAAWAQIVASYDEPAAPGEGGWPAAEDLPADLPEDPAPPAPAAVIPVIPRAFVVRAPVLGPRDHPLPDDEDDDEGHFVPPEPPPLPEADATTKFAWLGAAGGPVLMLVYVLTGTPMPWWAVVVGVGGFLGGFATLVARMKDAEDDDEGPHGGAVV